MRTLRMPAWTLALVFVTFSISQAKTTYAYVANYNSNTVSVINTTNNTVVTTIPVGNYPWGVAVNQAGSTAYVTNYYGGNTVSVILPRSETCELETKCNRQNPAQAKLDGGTVKRGS